ncbi:5c76d6df-178a-443d-8018-1bffc72757ad [Sclerotinia trifoliorum]|uniref:5c76d6df-178a-443d-8018-1bffc72757ad n=1 Tax=Sclerotinia trifoliorum TaxID=28548 RepID=A0A8H2ZKP7_9HELO|nr:5c76d6df-178a-443d-8018-1bffc72757ad [Sclerotinia trifoliorum]
MSLRHSYYTSSFTPASIFVHKLIRPKHLTPGTVTIRPSYRCFHGARIHTSRQNIGSFPRPRIGSRIMAPSPPPKSDLEKQYMSSTSKPKADSKSKKPIAVPQPSSSILLISPQNQILLLHRIRTSSAFPSAHVFPGGNLDSYHESPIPPPSSPSRHRDSEVYRIGAIRECFEECGILLARPSGDDEAQRNDNQRDDLLLEIPSSEREKARKEIHSKNTKFASWVQEIGGKIDTTNLLPFTRWITPSNLPKRFTTQMYIYFLPLDAETGIGGKEKMVQIPRDDGGIEHTAAEFGYCEDWLKKARRNEIILFPPQFYLMNLLASFLSKPGEGEKFSRGELKGQRERVLEFLKGDGGDGTGVEWGEKVMSPIGMGMRRSDGE